MDPVFDELSSVITVKTVILGIGNTLRSDDGFGALLAGQIKDKVSLKVFDTGVTPENFLGSILKERPDTVLLIDAVDFKVKPAEMKIFNMEEIETHNFFLTHNASIKMIYDFLKEDINAKFYLLAIQPQNIGFGEVLNPKLLSRLKELKSWFLIRHAKYEPQYNK